MGTVIQHDVEEMAFDTETGMLSCKVPKHFFSVLVQAFKEGKKITYEIKIKDKWQGISTHSAPGSCSPECTSEVLPCKRDCKAWQ